MPWYEFVRSYCTSFQQRLDRRDSDSRLLACFASYHLVLGSWKKADFLAIFAVWRRHLPCTSTPPHTRRYDFVASKYGEFFKIVVQSSSWTSPSANAVTP